MCDGRVGLPRRRRILQRSAGDYAIVVLMMAYGIRGILATELLLDDIDWQHSRIRICAKKGGKEVVLPLIKAVVEAIIGYLGIDSLRLHSGSIPANQGPIPAAQWSRYLHDCRTLHGKGRG